jgi:hypothetical protein
MVALPMDRDLVFLSPFVLRLVLACIYGSRPYKEDKKVNDLSLRVICFWPASPWHIFKVDPEIGD